MLVPREPFSLDAKFLDMYRGREPAWGPLGLLVYARTYAAPLPDGGTEVFWQTCQRVIEGMYQIQKGHCKRLGLPWSDAKAQDSAQEAFERMFAFKWLPPGRGLSKMGTDYLFRYGGAALYNCGAYTTENIGNKNIPNAFSRPFTWTLIMSMLGVGVGLDTRGAGTVSIINPTRTDEPYVIPDSREGWSDYLQRVLEAYVDYNVALPNNVDYSLIRPLGAPIKGFGGTASGPGALQKISARIHTLMRMYMGKPVDSRFIVDLANSIGECVVAGGTRRSSQILFSTIDDENFMRLKDWADPETAKWPRWASNNSVFVDENSDFSKAAALTASNGEPGYLFLNNAREYGRMSDPPDYKDMKIVHTNPCGEISLMSGELCNLVETFPHNCNGYEDYERTLKFAYLYAKTVTLVPTHDEETNAVMLRNRRIGCSQSGIQDNITKIGLRTHLHWCDKGYQYVQKLDTVYSDWLCIPRSIKTTTIKPSGCRPWDALTSTDKGLLTLQELFEEHEDEQQWSPVQEPVYALQGDKKSRITKTYVNGPSRLVRLTLSYGITLESTPQHQWYVTHNYDRTEQERLMPVNDWVAADKLFVGDILDFNLGNYTNPTAHKFKHLNTTAIKMRCDHAPIKQPKEMTEDIAWLLGYLWGDGAMSPTNYRVRFVDQHEAHLIKCQRIMQDNFGVTANIVTCKDRDAKAFDVASKYLWHWLIKNDIFKYHSDRLDVIPAAVRRSSRDHIVAFIAGLIDADGCVSDKGDRFTVMIASAEDLFAKHLQHVAWSVGLGFGRSLNSLGANFQRPLAKHVWLMQLGICVTPEASAVLIRNSCKMAGKGPWNYEVATKQTVFPGKILKIETIDETVDTYDVEVEGTHWYYAGAFKSHNTVSKLVGCREGIHHEKSEYILQAIRIHNTSPLIEPLRAANYRIEEAVNEPNTVVVYFPIHSVGQRPADTISMWEQLELGALMQYYWSDNLVSQTIDCDKEKEGPFIQQALEMYAHRIKGTSFLPRNDHGYVQAPKTPITKQEYDDYVATLKPYNLDGLQAHDTDERYCSNGVCEAPVRDEEEAAQ